MLKARILFMIMIVFLMGSHNPNPCVYESPPQQKPSFDYENPRYPSEPEDEECEDFFMFFEICRNLKILVEAEEFDPQHYFFLCFGPAASKFQCRS